MIRFRILNLLTFCIGCLCWFSCANNSVTGLAKKQEKQGRHIDGAYEQLGYLLCSDSKTQYFVSKEEVVPIATMGEMIKYRVPSIDQNGLAVFSDKEEKIRSLSHLSPVGNIGAVFTVNDQNMIYVFSTKKNYALTVISDENPELSSVYGWAKIDLDSYFPISSQLSENARGIYKYNYQNRMSVGFDVYKDGRVIIWKDNHLSFRGEYPYISDLEIPLNQLSSQNTASKIITHLEKVAACQQVKKNLLSLQQLAADFNGNNRYLARQKYEGKWYYIETQIDRLSWSGYDIYNNFHIDLDATFSYNGEKCDLVIQSSSLLLAELNYPQKIIVQAQFTGSNDRGDWFLFENAIPVFYKQE